MDDIAGSEAFGGEETSSCAFDIRFSDLDVHLYVSLVDFVIEWVELMSIDAILGVAGSEREDFCCWLRAHTSALYTFIANVDCSYNPSKEFILSFVSSQCHPEVDITILILSWARNINVMRCSSNLVADVRYRSHSEDLLLK